MCQPSSMRKQTLKMEQGSEDDILSLTIFFLLPASSPPPKYGELPLPYSPGPGRRDWARGRHVM